MATKNKTKKTAPAKKLTRLQIALADIQHLEETAQLSNAIIFYLLKDSHTSVHVDDFKEVYQKYLPKEFDALHPIDDFQWELDRDILKQQSVVSAGKISLIKKLPQPDMSPIYGKG